LYFWYFVIGVEVIVAILDSTNLNVYWCKLRSRLNNGGSGFVTIRHKLKWKTIDWKKYAANEQLAMQVGTIAGELIIKLNKSAQN